MRDATGRDEDESQLKSKADRGSERKQDGIEPAECIDGMGGMMREGMMRHSWRASMKDACPSHTPRLAIMH